MQVVHYGHLDKELGQNLLNIAHIQVEGEISTKNQHQFMD